MGRNTKILALGGLALILLVQFVILPLVDWRTGSARRKARAWTELEQIQELAGRYRELIEARDKLAKGGNKAQGTLYAIVDGTARNLKISKKIKFIKPERRDYEGGVKQEIVSVGLTGLYVDEAVRFLHAMEVDVDGIAVREAHFKRDKNQLLDVDLVMSMLVPDA